MKKLMLFAVLILSLNCKAQHTEVGLFAGISNYQGDLSAGSFKGIFAQSRPSVGLFGRYNFNDFFAARLAFNYGQISSDDALSNNQAQIDRNLNFRSTILEFGAMGEINIPGFQPYALAKVFSPYVFVGIMGVYYNPKTSYENSWVKLQPLGTEGQGLAEYPDRKKYSKVNFSIPFGIGVKWAITDLIVIGFEAGPRKTFTDYLDDVSTTYVDYNVLAAGNGELAATLSNRTGELIEDGVGRGDSTNKDWYILYGVTVSYNFLDNGLIGGRRKSKRKSGCPGF